MRLVRNWIPFAVAGHPIFLERNCSNATLERANQKVVLANFNEIWAVLPRPESFEVGHFKANIDLKLPTLKLLFEMKQWPILIRIGTYAQVPLWSLSIIFFRKTHLASPSANQKLHSQLGPIDLISGRKDYRNIMTLLVC